MSDLAVTLPEPSPEDDEDVVWGLSTASALWARGERTDAVVWLRRAADAATAAGQDFRASQLGMYATEIEDALNGAAAANLPPPPEAPAQASAPPPAEPVAAAIASSAPPPPPPAPVASTPPPRRENPWSRTLPVTPSNAPAATPAPRIDVIEAPPLAPAAAPAAPSSLPAPPAQQAPPVSLAAPPAAPSGDGKPVRSQRAKPRAPILNPWSEPGTPVNQAAAAPATSIKPAAPPPPPPPRSGPSELVVEVESRATMDSDEDVVTSAAPLETWSKKPAQIAKAPPPPPPSQSAKAPPDASAAHDSPPASTQAVSHASPRPAAPIAVAPQPHAPAPPPRPASIAPAPEARSPGSLGSAAIAVAAKKVGLPSPIPAPKPGPLELPPEQRSVGGVLLEEIPALANLPHDAQGALAMAGDVQQIGADEEIAGFGAALLVDGTASVCARVVDVPAARAVARSLVPSRGSLADGIALRVVAGEGGARIVVWSEAVFTEALKAFPWVLDEIRDVADRLQSLAGLTMGPLGDLDEQARASLTERFTLRGLAAGEVFLERGVATPGILVIGVGSIDLVAEDGATRELTSGDLVFASSALDGRVTAETARAGVGGAILLVADRKVTQALLAELPQLVGIIGNA